MMNAKQIHSMWRSGLYVTAAALFVVAAVVTTPAKAAGAENPGFALLLQASPSDGGNIQPGDGVHRVQIGESVPLIAVPKKGYRFLYWLGDVGQVDRTRTSIRMDSPKLVVAVFEREEFEDLVGAGIQQGDPHPQLWTSPTESGDHTVDAYSYSSGGGGGGGGEEEDDDDDFPVPTPEPMTALLLGLGAMLSARRKRV